jgi:hypothetical protein
MDPTYGAAMLPSVTQPARSSDAPGGPVLGSALSIKAEMLSQLLARPGSVPARWLAPGFGRQVDLVRAHLRPIRSHESLDHSYAREHFHIDRIGTVPPSPEGLLRRSATEVAYAHRWLELSGRRGEGSWITLLGEP